MISDEAVEAAWVAFCATGDIQAALEAAEPHLLAEVWDEAYGKGFEAARGEPDTPNPYRSQA